MLHHLHLEGVNDNDNDISKVIRFIRLKGLDRSIRTYVNQLEYRLLAMRARKHIYSDIQLGIYI